MSNFFGLNVTLFKVTSLEVSVIRLEVRIHWAESRIFDHRLWFPLICPKTPFKRLECWLDSVFQTGCSYD